MKREIKRVSGVLGPLFFAIYRTRVLFLAIISVIRRYRVSCHCCADDTPKSPSLIGSNHSRGVKFCN